MAIKKINGKVKIYCDASLPSGDGCTVPEIPRGSDKCKRGHTAKEVEAHRKELDGFHGLTGAGDQGNVVDKKDQPRTPHQIYDQVIKDNS